MDENICTKVISVIEKRLLGNDKKWTLVHSWTAKVTVRLVHFWADGGYQDSPLKTAQDAVAIAPKCAHN